MKYGKFKKQSVISQSLLDVMNNHGNYAYLEAYQRESLRMICNKLGRILNGDPNYADSWKDVAGYAQLVVYILNGEEINVNGRS